MKREITSSTADQLLAALNNATGDDGEFIYDVHQSLFKRWRSGVDLAPLVSLIKSDFTEDRLKGAYYLGEAVPLNIAKEDIIGLASDPLAYCRRTFVTFVTESGIYDDTIARELAKNIVDFDVNVRVSVINWAVSVPNNRFDNFSQLVELGVGVSESEFWGDVTRTRGLRGLDIALRLRRGENIENIRSEVVEEDSFTFEYFSFFKNRVQRYVTSRNINSPQD